MNPEKAKIASEISQDEYESVLYLNSQEQLSDSRFVVDFWPTGRCDMECPFCYGADVPSMSWISKGEGKKIWAYEPTEETVQLTGDAGLRPEMSMGQMQEVIHKLKGIGVTTITIAGGEPLIRKETPDLIRFASGLGLEVYLSTDGTFLSRYYEEIKNHISVLGLPLDGSTPRINHLMGRRDYLHGNIRSILGYFKDHPPPHRVKVGTVVSKINDHDLESIGRLLFETPGLYPPDVWRLYQFETLKRGAQNRELYEISDQAFSSVCEMLAIRFPNVAISARSNQTHVNAYFFITPDGMLQIVDSKHRSIVDMLRVGIEELGYTVVQFRSTVEKSSQNRVWLGNRSPSE